MRGKKALLNLSRRERQIMDVLYRDRQATAAEVLAGLPDPPGYSAVRAMLRVLENKGHIRHVAEGTRYVYLPTLARKRASRPALASVLETFFDGSTEKAVAALLELSPAGLSDQELERLSHLIEQARLEGR
ncbi:MAG: BlaI/MecI/CopY family transcriptional regulator [Acidobacteriota bacterium]